MTLSIAGREVRQLSVCANPRHRESCEVIDWMYSFAVLYYYTSALVREVGLHKVHGLRS